MACHCEQCSPGEYERAGLIGRDGMPDDGPWIASDAGRLRHTLDSQDAAPRLDGRDVWVARLTRLLDDPRGDEAPEQAEEEPEPDELPPEGPGGWPRNIDVHLPKHYRGGDGELRGRDRYLERHHVEAA